MDAAAEKSATDYQDVPVVAKGHDNDGSVDLLQEGKLTKKGHQCCGGCCDMRRAVVIVNAVNLVVVISAMVSFLVTRNASQNYNNYTDDSVRTAMQQFSAQPIGLFIAIQSFQIVCSILGIVGALKYNIYLTGIAASAFCFQFVMAIVGFNIEGLLYAGFFAYPHYFFIKEVREGTMSQENYPNEEMSCCCL